MQKGKRMEKKERGKRAQHSVTNNTQTATSGKTEGSQERPLLS